jgi:8-oxo-dGTP pyrophosphatase MutT (NUDIX family)
VDTEPNGQELTRWTIHGERLIDDTRRLRLSIASVELPDGATFEQYVLRIPKAAMMVVLDDQDRVLMMWRYRFIIDRWVWELPGGYVDPDEDPAATAAREVEEETGWRPLNVEPLAALQPIVGSPDAENLLYVARVPSTSASRTTSTRPSVSPGFSLIPSVTASRKARSSARHHRSDCCTCLRSSADTRQPVGAGIPVPSAQTESAPALMARAAV